MDRRYGYQKGMARFWLANNWLPKLVLVVCVVAVMTLCK